MEQVVHPIPPVWNRESKILILGSFPSVKSREALFFYHHPQNRFWKVLALVTGEPVPKTISEKKEFLLRRHIAVWDAIASCAIEGSSDSSIRDAAPTDLSQILEHAPIAAIFCNGAASYRCFQKYQESATGRSARKLPSTSPANAAWSLERLAVQWASILEFL